MNKFVSLLAYKKLSAILGKLDPVFHDITSDCFYKSSPIGHGLAHAFPMPFATPRLHLREEQLGHASQRDTNTGHS